MTYDQEADVLYINFRKPGIATDSELTDEDIIIRYVGDEVIGVTILHASARSGNAAQALGTKVRLQERKEAPAQS
jgi:uncharacterized protein YuzE